MEIIGGIAVAVVGVVVVAFMFIFAEEIGEFIAFLVFGLAVPVGILSVAIELIGKGDQGGGGFLIGIVLVWWLIVGYFIKEYFS